MRFLKRNGCVGFGWEPHPGKEMIVWMGLQDAYELAIQLGDILGVEHPEVSRGTVERKGGTR